ncbi:transport and Golgi organization protein 1-like isoform X1 [Tigriopus californicus]|uniref:transport and Golgi organization protein 1-like isoform X1 n=1 Tax=Tigriopus californicus TaxID=6832 RepID=UPI0027D9FEEB|nr:transport and Golgi organization protein 1-like isoform X1 [Tigriopus californicus]
MATLRCLLWTVLTLVLCLESNQALSNLRRCGDEQCQQVVSEGRTILRYHAKSPEMLSFNSDLPVKILSKEAGQDLDLWGVEIQGRRGYVNKRHIQETKVLIRDLPFEVNTDDPQVPHPESSEPSPSVVNQSDPVSSVPTPVSAETVPTDPVQSNYDVVDGTTIYFDEPVQSINQEPIKSAQTSVPDIKPTQTKSRASETLETLQATPDVTGSLSSQTVEAQSTEAIRSIDLKSDGQPTTPPKVDLSQTPESPPLQDDSPTPLATPALDILQEPIKPSATPNQMPTNEYNQDDHNPTSAEETNEVSSLSEPQVENANQDSLDDGFVTDEEKHEEEEEEDIDPEEENEIDLEKRKQFIQSQLRDEENHPVDDNHAVDKARLEKEEAKRLELEKNQIEKIKKQVNDASQANLESTTPQSLDNDKEPEVLDGLKPDTNLDQETLKVPPNSDDGNMEDLEEFDSTASREQKEATPEAPDEQLPSTVAQDQVSETDEQPETLQPLDNDQHDTPEKKSPGISKTLHSLNNNPDTQEAPSNIPASNEENPSISVTNEENDVISDAQEEDSDIPVAQEDNQEPQDDKPGASTGDLDHLKPNDHPDNIGLPENTATEAEKPEDPEESLDAADIQQERSDKDEHDESLEYGQGTTEEPVPLDRQENVQEDAEPSHESGGGFFGSIFGSSEPSTPSPDVLEDDKNTNNKDEPDPINDYSDEQKLEVQNNPDRAEVPSVPENYEVPNSLNYEEIRFHDPNEYSTESPPEVLNEEKSHESAQPGEVEETTGTPEPDPNPNFWGFESHDEKTTTTTPAPLDVKEDVPAFVQAIDDSSKVREEVDPSPQEPVEMEETKGDFAETVEHYIEESNSFLPEFLTSVLSRPGSSSRLSTNALVIASVLVVLFVILFVTALAMEKSSKEGSLKTKLASLEKELNQVRNESLIIKREAETFLKNGGISELEPVKIVTNEPPAELLNELVTIREEMARSKERVLELQSEKDNAVQEKVKTEEDLANLRLMYDRAQQELTESESIVQECLDEKKRNQAKGGLDIDITTAIDTLRRQLSSQQEAVGKYEAKIKKRESELKEKTQDLRKQRADTANAKLQLTKMTQERDELAKRVSNSEESSEENAKLKSELEDLKQTLYRIKEECENKDSDLETKSTEIEVLQLTVEQLKTLTASTSNNNQKSSKLQGNGDVDNDNEGDGWDCEDPLVDSDMNILPDFNAIQDMAQLQVDLRKAQAACEKLSEQLVQAETAKEDFETQLFEQKQELENARKSKENSLKEKTELGKKLEVLTNYFNQREGELQKQLGMTANRLNDTEFSSQSASKQIMLLQNEVDSYQSQLKTLRAEMEEQERSLKAQNANLEKKQHESWVTVRQESRRSAEAQSELQTLRTRLTTVESKMVEKEFEITQLQEENMSLKETIEKISRSSQPKHEPGAIKGNKVVSFALENGNDNNVYTNGNGSSASSTHNDPHGGASGGPASLPDLPPLPMLPTMMTMAAAPQPPPYMPYIPPDVRPAPLGRRSPGPRGYSPSPPHSDDYYPSPTGSASRYRRDSSRSPERSPRNRYERYSRDRISPDRMSNRSGRSDRSLRYD